MHKTLIDVIGSTFRKYPLKTAYTWREKKEIHSVTYGELAQNVKRLSTALVSLGIKQGDRVGLIADVSYYWILGNLSIQNIGAVDVPRGTDSTGEELAFILNHAGCQFALVHNYEQVEKIESYIKKGKKTQGVKTYIVLTGEKESPKTKTAAKTKAKTHVLFLDEVLEKGETSIVKNSKLTEEIKKRHKNIDRHSLASIIYTSGTTGKPKGVMLTQGNFVSQINILPIPFGLSSEDRMLTLLPPWHVFGRILEYLFFECGASIYYTDIKNMGDDLKKFKPTYVPAVPRVWEGIYNKIIGNVKKGGKEKIFNFFKLISLVHFRCMQVLMNRERLYEKRMPLLNIAYKAACFLTIGVLAPLKLLGHVLVFRKIIAATGGSLKGSISGGGALPDYIDEFFAAVGVNIYEGYGLTETTPVLAVRLPGRIVLGTVGPLVAMTEMKVLSIDGDNVTGIAGKKGTLYVRGPQVMKGYYQDEEKTATVMDRQGWFNTGDLVKITVNGEISIVGRSKDTIVLRGGENVEPVPIEDALLKSPYIDQVMLTGQDKKSLGALIVPDFEHYGNHCRQNNLPVKMPEECANDSVLHGIINDEIRKLNSAATGFKAYERVSRFEILTKPFEVGDEMSNTFKIKRFVVSEKYKDLIDKMHVQD